jgi:hypothetical protein
MDISLLEAGLVSGAIGDLALQLANKIGLGNTGLRSYFANQGCLSAVARASALTGFWSYVYGNAFRPTYMGFITFALALDVLYRNYYEELGFSDLDDYYKMNSVGATLLYNAGAATMVWFLAEEWKR